MKRDWNMIKCLLSKTEKLAPRDSLTYATGDDSDSVVGHAALLVKEGYIEGSTPNPEEAVLLSLTMKGHDLIAKLRAQNGC